MRLTLKTINDELAKRGATAHLAKAASGYFYFESGEAADWLDKTVNVPTINSLTLAEWMAELERLKKVNAEIMGTRGEASAEAETDQVQPVNILASAGIRYSYDIILESLYGRPHTCCEAQRRKGRLGVDRVHKAPLDIGRGCGYLFQALR